MFLEESRNLYSEEYLNVNVAMEVSEMYDYLETLRESMRKLEIDCMIAEHKSIVNEDASIINEAAGDAIKKIISSIKAFIVKIVDWIKGVYDRVFRKSAVLKKNIEDNANSINPNATFEAVNVFQTYEQAVNVYMKILGKANGKSKKDYDKATEILKSAKDNYNKAQGKVGKMTYQGSQHGVQLVNFFRTVEKNMGNIKQWQDEAKNDLQHWESTLSSIMNTSNDDPKKQELIADASAAINYYTAESAALGQFLTISDKHLTAAASIVMKLTHGAKKNANTNNGTPQPQQVNNQQQQQKQQPNQNNNQSNSKPKQKKPGIRQKIKNTANKVRNSMRPNDGVKPKEF